jgi:RNA recognition motif-containing protein
MSQEQERDTTFNNNFQSRGRGRGTLAQRGGRGNGPRRNYFGFPRRNFSRRGGFRNQFRGRNFGFRNFNRFGRTTNYRRLYLWNLYPFIRRQELYSLFRQCGRLIQCNVNYNQNGRTRTAFLQYFFPQDARRALRQFNGYMYRGYTIRLSFRRPFSFGFGVRTINTRFNNNLFRRGQRRMVFRRNPNRRTAFRRRRQ